MAGYRKVTNYKNTKLKKHIRIWVLESVGEEMEVFTHLWKIKALPIAQLCAWRTLQDRLATLVNLEKEILFDQLVTCVV